MVTEQELVELIKAAIRRKDLPIRADPATPTKRHVGFKAPNGRLVVAVRRHGGEPCLDIKFGRNPGSIDLGVGLDAAGKKWDPGSPGTFHQNIPPPVTTEQIDIDKLGRLICERYDYVTGLPWRVHDPA